MKLFELIKEEAEEQDRNVTSKFFKVGVKIATAVCTSLRGSEVFMELAALRKHIQLGRGGVVPMNPMKAGTDSSTAPIRSSIMSHITFKMCQFVLIIH